MNFKFIHTADLHLDSPFRGLKQIPEYLYGQVRQSTFSAYDYLINHCIEKNVDFLIISGDIFDLEDRSIKAQIFFLKGLKKLDSLGIHTYIIHGNHDPVNKLRSEWDWPVSVHFFSDKEVEKFIFKKDDFAIQLLGRSYPTKAFKENIVNDFLVENSSADFNIGILHTNVDGDPSHDPYCPSNLKDLLAANIDYWALGHIHKGKILADSAPAVVYPGNIQGRHINETGQKGCVLVEVSHKSIKSLDWLPTAKIIWEEINLDISGYKSLQRVVDYLELELDKLLIQFSTPLIIRLNLIGDTELHFTLNKENKAEEIQEILNEIYPQQSQWIWVENVKINTKPTIPITEILKQDTFLADYLKKLQNIRDDGKDLIYQEVAAELFKNRLLRKHLDNLSTEDIDVIVGKAVNLGLDYFLTEEGDK